MFACCRYTSAFMILLAALAVCDARAEPDVEDVKEHLSAVKQHYKDEAEKFKKTVGTILDKREEAARSKGEKKLLDQIVADQKAFTVYSDLPSITNSLKDPLLAARAKLDRTYTESIKSFVRLKSDAAAQATEKEQLEFFISSGILLGRKKYLVTLKHTNLRVERNWFTTNGAAFSPNGAPLTWNGEPAPHTIFLHPPPNGAGRVSYPVDPKWTAFRTTVGVPTFKDATNRPGSPLTFEVLGDDKSLWKSQPVTQRDDFQGCDIRLERIKVLTLKVHCPGPATAAQAVWFEPVLVD